ncbi:MAG: DUF1292 domain-containing protein [Lachnospiraceae bacterium]|nr:DUF1292 domain-containing protein [Lachnospiraceae bacterium]
MDKKDNQTISVTGEFGEKIDLIVLEKTEFGGSVYILAEESEEDETVAYILKQSGENDGDFVYTLVEDEKELDAVAPIFEELLEGEIEIVSDETDE